MSGCNMGLPQGLHKDDGHALNSHLKGRLQERCTHYKPFLEQSMYKTQAAPAPKPTLLTFQLITLEAIRLEPSLTPDLTKPRFSH